MRIQYTRVSVQVPATSANLGPGFDSLGLALDLCDELEVEATTGAVEISVDGEGARALPSGEDHLVVRALRRGLDHAGAPQTGLRLHATNRIPHGRGLGSSAAATVAGLLLARGMISDPDALDDQTVLQLASEFEGHPDNAAPALLGGVVLSWMQGGIARAVELSVAEQALRPVVLLPTTTLATHQARGLLPAEVPHADAVFNASRSALLVHALAGAPELLVEATEDRLHQDQRAAGMPESVELMRVLRREGHPAVISGAGPSVLVMAGARAQIAPLVRRFVADPAAWRIAEVPLRQLPAAPVVG
ncbi:homoserine kinase [Brachybacterium faecium DSM 4810]|uniref:Homoserine kinase n=1 Tax=Brachybacterium faecium (strain ATCC 43885 / DSM 4810 / JCM 11609 / LMG 19847 / NBRC 14762 / NCIMB 9860 / 6-10) TaxID=446465 RepID=C7MDU1_BRAFD|nr:homoserine kinase [Brachybacterium faecium]ACU85748.1 homoserine kinase [Brachybacterium faecium DSM 4810]